MLAKKYPWEILRTRVSQGKEEKVVFFFPTFFSVQRKKKKFLREKQHLGYSIRKRKTKEQK